MRNDEFENHLRQQPFRAVPEIWKGRILNAAREAEPASTFDRSAGGVGSRSWGRVKWDWLWPHPLAWAALAVAWLAAGMIHWSSREHAQHPVLQTPSAPAEAMLILQEQQRRWGELVAVWRSGPHDPARSDPHFKQKPRSHHHENLHPRVG